MFHEPIFDADFKRKHCRVKNRYRVTWRQGNFERNISLGQHVAGFWKQFKNL